MKNSDLSIITSNLFDLLELLGERLKNSQRQTRGQLKKPTPVHQLISEFNELREKLDEQIRELVQEMGGDYPHQKARVHTVTHSRLVCSRGDASQDRGL